VIVHRICKATYAGEIFSGNGGLTAGGRWHSKGRRVVYTAQTLSLAAFELFVHLGRHDMKIELVCARADIPDSVAIETVERNRLPSNWNELPPNPATAAIGDRWLADSGVAVLKVPAAVIPDEYNYLLNPEHRQFTTISFAKPQRFTLDPRLWN